ncbi:MAG: hypothetical protein CO132_02925 [Candidatus Kerfeldbacteria bacterium CG_4_9_14_3_um_filter_45_8]|nr:MAG: hypothetical protein CO132_02925 [Candidatus Kerfeldbacteria bacterium CG_4_9_14_3_um_filter_45_8]
MAQSLESLRRPRAEASDQSARDQGPHDLWESAGVALEETSERMADLSRHFSDPMSFDTQMAGITERLLDVERAIQRFALLEGSEAELYHHEVTEGFFTTLSELERLLNLIEERKNSGLKGKLSERYALYPNPKMEETMRREDRRQEQHLPAWIISVLAPDYGFDSQYAYADSSISDCAEEEAELDDDYGDILISSSPERLSALEALLAPMILRAAKYLHVDPDDHSGNRHRVMNLLTELKDEWHKRYPLIGRKYGVLLRHAESIILLIESVYYTTGRPESELVEEFDEDFEADEEWTDRPAEVIAQFQETLTDLEDLTFRLRHEHRSHAHALRHEIETELSEARADLDWLSLDLSVQAYDRLERSLMLALLRIEEVINTVDMRRQSQDSGPIVEQWQALAEDNSWQRSLESTVAELGIRLPSWLVDYLAHDIVAPDENRAYMTNKLTAQVEQAQDRRFEELMTLPASGNERRLKLDTLFREMLLRAVKSFNVDPHDNSKEQVRAREVAAALGEEWQSRLPIVEGKYQAVVEAWDDVMEVLAAEFYPGRLVDRAMAGDEEF